MVCPKATAPVPTCSPVLSESIILIISHTFITVLSVCSPLPHRLPGFTIFPFWAKQDNWSKEQLLLINLSSSHRSLFCPVEPHKGLTPNARMIICLVKFNLSNSAYYTVQLIKANDWSNKERKINQKGYSLFTQQSVKVGQVTTQIK